ASSLSMSPHFCVVSSGQFIPDNPKLELAVVNQRIAVREFSIRRRPPPNSRWVRLAGIGSGLLVLGGGQSGPCHTQQDQRHDCRPFHRVTARRRSPLHSASTTAPLDRQ